MKMLGSRTGIRAQQLSIFALGELQKNGPDIEALGNIGSRLVVFGQRLQTMKPPLTETVLWEDADGTFELVLRPVGPDDASGLVECHDTWAIYTPRQGVVSFSKNGRPASELHVNDIDHAKSQDRIRMHAVGSHALVLCLYGISRKHLP